VADVAPEPPQPPEIDRGLHLRWPQLIGITVIALIPILAAAGVFGERWAKAEATSSRLRAQVEYPSRLRAKLSKPMTVSIENRTTEPMDTVEVAFDSAYVDRFTGANFVPSPDEAYVIPLTDVKPGETRRVHVEFEGDIVGRHSGRIVVRARGDSAAVVVRTIVFP
jgi:hypothetical protein